VIGLAEHYPFKNTPLPYGYDALEPYIDTKTMHLHHDRHLQAYVDNLNATLKNCPSLQGMTIEQLIKTAYRLPEALCTPVSRNAGGVFNHRFYFDGMAPAINQQPKEALAAAIEMAFCSLDSFKEKFKAAALSVFGSGYAWLVCDKRCNLCIVTTPNQETTLNCRLCPILTIDVWEHAYYLKHYNERASYIDDWFNVVNWKIAEERYLCCREGGWN